MAIKSALTLLLAMACLTARVHGGWSFGSSFDDLFKSLGSDKSNEDESTEVTKTTSSPKIVITAATLKPTDLTEATESSVDRMKKIIDEELKKFQASSQDDKKESEAAPAVGISADMIRKIIAEELNKLMPTSTTTSSPPYTPLYEPIWKKWSNAKNWAKQPGPNGEPAPGFIGSLQSQYGPASGYGPGYAHPLGSPGWVWSQISPKWGTNEADPTVVPPSQIIDNGAWQILMPPQSAVASKS